MHAIFASFKFIYDTHAIAIHIYTDSECTHLHHLKRENVIKVM